MRKIGIIGIGHVGATLAYTLVSRRLTDELVLFDKNEKLVAAETNDLLDGQVGQTGYVAIKPSELAELKDCDILVFSAGKIAALAETEDRFGELQITAAAVRQWAPKIKESGFNGILLVISNPCDVITRYLQEETGLPKKQVFGTGTALDTARMQHAVGKKLGIHPNSAEGYVLGEHGVTQFTAWSGVKIAGRPITELLEASELAQLDEDARQGGWVTFDGKGYTSYGIANQAALLCEAIFTNSQVIKPVSVFSPEDQVYVGLPAKIKRDGISEIYPQTLTAAEQEKWQNTISHIKEMYAAIQ